MLVETVLAAKADGKNKNRLDEKMLEDIFQKKLTTEETAIRLLGRLLIHEGAEGRTSGFIVETEAYLGVPDLAAHSYNGRRTKRTEVMYWEPGTLYVHQTRHHIMLNIITQEEGRPEGILIRAVEPYEGMGKMVERRGRAGAEVTNGPAKLVQAMGITLKENGGSIYGERVFLDPCLHKIPQSIARSPRVGIPNKGEWTDKHLRYFVEGNPYVSRRRGKPAPHNGWKLNPEKEELFHAKEYDRVYAHNHERSPFSL